MIRLFDGGFRPHVRRTRRSQVYPTRSFEKPFQCPLGVAGGRYFSGSKRRLRIEPPRSRTRTGRSGIGASARCPASRRRFFNGTDTGRSAGAAEQVLRPAPAVHNARQDRLSWGGEWTRNFRLDGPFPVGPLPCPGRLPPGGYGPRPAPILVAPMPPHPTPCLCRWGIGRFPAFPQLLKIQGFLPVCNRTSWPLLPRSSNGKRPVGRSVGKICSRDVPV